MIVKGERVINAIMKMRIKRKKIFKIQISIFNSKSLKIQLHYNLSLTKLNNDDWRSIPIKYLVGGYCPSMFYFMVLKILRWITRLITEILGNQIEMIKVRYFLIWGVKESYPSYVFIISLRRIYPNFPHQNDKELLKI